VSPFPVTSLFPRWLTPACALLASAVETARDLRAEVRAVLRVGRPVTPNRFPPVETERVIAAALELSPAVNLSIVACPCFRSRRRCQNCERMHAATKEFHEACEALVAARKRDAAGESRL
jgi:hypothetical protein